MGGFHDRKPPQKPGRMRGLPPGKTQWLEPKNSSCLECSIFFIKGLKRYLADPFRVGFHQHILVSINFQLGGGFKYFLCSPLLGEDSHFDSYVSTGLVQPPTSQVVTFKFRPLSV